MWLLFWIGFCIIPALIASNKGRSAAGWFFGSLLLSPILGAIIVAVLPPLGYNLEREAISSGSMKKCPQCAELIKAEAKVCRFCHYDFSDERARWKEESEAVRQVPTGKIPKECPLCAAETISALEEGKRYYCRTCKSILQIAGCLLALVLVGCAHVPIATQPLVDRQVSAPTLLPVQVRVVDNRESKFRSERTITELGFPVAKYTLGDREFDAPLATLFERLVTARYGNAADGLLLECRLKSFLVAWKPNAATGIPVLGIFAAGADSEWSGMLKVDLSLVRSDNALFFHKAYEATLTEARPATTTRAQHHAEVMDKLDKLFTQFIAEFDVDLARLRP